MLKKYFVIVFLLITFEGLCRKSPINLCKALNPPNNLLLDHFLKIHLRKNCSIEPVLSLYKRPKKIKGCYYSVPKKWAESIDDQNLSKTGILLKSNKRSPCPLLAYKDFELITFQGLIRLEETLWKTNQVNHIKRVLRRKLRIEPKNSPAVISPKKSFVIEVYRGNKGIQVPVISDKNDSPKKKKA